MSLFVCGLSRRLPLNRFEVFLIRPLRMVKSQRLILRSETDGLSNVCPLRNRDIETGQEMFRVRLLVM